MSVVLRAFSTYSRNRAHRLAGARPWPIQVIPVELLFPRV